MKRIVAAGLAALLLLTAAGGAWAEEGTVNLTIIANEDHSAAGRSRQSFTLFPSGGVLTKEQLFDVATKLARHLNEKNKLDVAEVWVACSDKVPALKDESALALARYAKDGKGYSGDGNDAWTWEVWVAKAVPTKDDIRFIEAVEESIPEFRGKPAAELWKTVAKRLGMPEDKVPGIPMELVVKE